MGFKRIETRSWETKLEGEVFIHAGKSLEGYRVLRGNPVKRRAIERALGASLADLEETLPRGVLVARGQLVECISTVSAAKRFTAEIPFGDFERGRWAHVFTDVRPCRKTAINGRQKYFWAER